MRENCLCSYVLRIARICVSECNAITIAMKRERERERDRERDKDTKRQKDREGKRESAEKEDLSLRINMNIWWHCDQNKIYNFTFPMPTYSR